MKLSHKLKLNEASETIALIILLVSISYRTIIPEQVAFAANISGILFALSVNYSDRYIAALAALIFYAIFKNTWLVSDLNTITEAIRIFAISIPYMLIVSASKNGSRLLRRFVIFSAPIPIIGVLSFFNISIPFIDISSFVYSRMDGEHVRAASIFGNPNYYGAFIYFCTLIWMLTMMCSNLAYKYIDFLILLIFLAGGLFSLSRSFQAAIFILLPVFVNIFLGSRSAYVRLIWIMLAAIGFAIILYYMAYYGVDNNLFLSRWVGDGGGAGSRLEGIHYASDILNQNFFKVFFGYGANAMSYYSDNEYQSHNSLVRVLLEYGGIFLVAFMAFVTASIFSGKADKDALMFRILLLISVFLMISTNDFFLLREFWLFLFSAYYLNRASAAYYVKVTDQQYVCASPVGSHVEQ